jgi:hypothetical protein
MLSPFKEMIKRYRFRLDKDIKAAVVSATAQGVLCEGSPSRGVSMGAYLNTHGDYF